MTATLPLTTSYWANLDLRVVAKYNAACDALRAANGGSWPDGLAPGHRTRDTSHRHTGAGCQWAEGSEHNLSRYSTMSYTDLKLEKRGCIEGNREFRVLLREAQAVGDRDDVRNYRESIDRNEQIIAEIEEELEYRSSRSRH